MDMESESETKLRLKDVLMYSGRAQILLMFFRSHTLEPGYCSTSTGLTLLEQVKGPTVRPREENRQ